MDHEDWFSAVGSSCGGRSHWCSFSLPRTRGTNLAGKTVYSCPKNYPIKREFGMWFCVDHLLLKSCSNSIKSLGNNWTNILELVMDIPTCQTLWWDLWRSQDDCDTLATWPICYIQICCGSTPLKIMTLTMFWITALVILRHWCLSESSLQSDCRCHDLSDMRNSGVKHHFFFLPSWSLFNVYHRVVLEDVANSNDFPLTPCHAFRSFWRLRTVVTKSCGVYV